MKKFILLFVCCLALQANAQINDSTLRKIPLKGATNFRDIGGYKTQDGRYVKFGKIYRSAELSKLTIADLDTLKNRNIHYVFDFRGPFEFEKAPDKLPNGAVWISLPEGSVNMNSQMADIMKKKTSGDSMMIKFYQNIEPFAKRYKPVFDTLIHKPQNEAVLYHCTAGKDRTGIATALILYSLGVDKNTIFNDYLASNYYRQNENQKLKKMLMDSYKMDESSANGLTGVKPEYLKATFDAIDKKYGSMDNFLKTEMGLDHKKIKKLRKLYTGRG